MNATLRGSDAAFKQTKNRFLEQLKDHLKASMTKLYTPEQITRRNKVVGAAVFGSANPAFNTLSSALFRVIIII